MLVFALSEIPEMGRGKGVRLQKYKDGGVLDLKTVHAGDRPVLAGFRRPHLHQVARGTGRMDRRPGLGRTHGAEGFPEDGQVWVG